MFPEWFANVIAKVMRTTWSSEDTWRLVWDRKVVDIGKNINQQQMFYQEKAKVLSYCMINLLSESKYRWFHAWWIWTRLWIPQHLLPISDEFCHKTSSIVAIVPAKPAHGDLCSFDVHLSVLCWTRDLCSYIFHLLFSIFPLPFFQWFLLVWWKKKIIRVKLL